MSWGRCFKNHLNLKNSDFKSKQLFIFEILYDFAYDSLTQVLNNRVEVGARFFYVGVSSVHDISHFCLEQICFLNLFSRLLP